MGKEHFGWWFKVKRQLNYEEMVRYEKYAKCCRELWGCEPAHEEIWRGVLSKLMDV